MRFFILALSLISFLSFAAPISVTVTGTTLCNNGTIERTVAGTMTTTCGDGWSVGALPVSPPPTTYKTMLDWNAASGTTWPEWTYNVDVTGFGVAGYELTGTDPNLGVGTSTAKIPSTRMFDKADYGAGTVLTFDTVDIAPSTTSGASAKFVSNLTDKQANWWVWYDSFDLNSRGITDADTDRMDFYMKISGTSDDPATIHIGTYVCYDVPDTGSTGCPYEGPNNNHYYHYLSLGSEAWVHVQLDEQPQHLRGDGRPPVNPPVVLYPEVGFLGYYSNLHQFYIEIRDAQDTQSTMWLDEIRFSSTNDYPEPNQNQQSVTSVWVGYWDGADEWQIAWKGEWSDACDNCYSTYEVRYSLSPITNANWESATPITPLSYTGSEYESNPSDYAIRTMTSYTHFAWTNFTLPNEVETAGDTIHFAIKDISIAGGNGGSLYPWNRTDQKDPPNAYIRTIDYTLRAN